MYYDVPSDVDSNNVSVKLCREQGINNIKVDVNDDDKDYVNSNDMSVLCIDDDNLEIHNDESNMVCNNSSEYEYVINDPETKYENVDVYYGDDNILLCTDNTLYGNVESRDFLENGNETDSVFYVEAVNVEKRELSTIDEGFKNVCDEIVEDREDVDQTMLCLKNNTENGNLNGIVLTTVDSNLPDLTFVTDIIWKH